jgi:hypothetical protein
LSEQFLELLDGKVIVTEGGGSRGEDIADGGGPVGLFQLLLQQGEDRVRLPGGDISIDQPFEGRRSFCPGR